MGIDRLCEQRLLQSPGVNANTVSMIRHGFDLTALPRRLPLPARPRRALIFSNQAWPGGWAAEVVAGCRSLGIEVDIVGLINRNPVDNPGGLLGQYDVVFAKGRSAFEAAAVGAAVIGCDGLGLGPMMSRANIGQCWEWNCGHKLLSDQTTPAAVAERLQQYDPDDASAVCDWVRKVGDEGGALQRWESLYRSILEQPAPAPDLQAEAAATLRAFTLLRRSERDEAIARWVADRRVREAAERESSLEATNRELREKLENAQPDMNVAPED